MADSPPEEDGFELHERLKAHLRELVDPKIREHHGRIVQGRRASAKQGPRSHGGRPIGARVAAGFGVWQLRRCM
jgi:hypothetical protein